MADFAGNLRERLITPHIAADGCINKTGNRRKTAIDLRTTGNLGYDIFQRCCNRIAEVTRLGQDRGWARRDAFPRSVAPLADCVALPLTASSTALLLRFSAAASATRLPRQTLRHPATLRQALQLALLFKRQLDRDRWLADGSFRSRQKNKFQ